MKPTEPVHVLHAIGFWRCAEALISFPHPKELVKIDWNDEERLRVADYLDAGISLRGYFGFSYCRFREGPPDDEMGTDDLTDGTWVWPQALSLYVRKYRVGLPDEFLAHVRASGYAIRNDLDLDELRARSYSYVHWTKWSRRERSNRLLALMAMFCRLR